MKKIILAAFALVCSLGLFANDPGVTEKVLDAFNKTFQNAEEVSWSSAGENSYEVKFKQNEISSRVYYDKDGNILKTYRYYHEQQLPLMILSKVKNRFADKSIFGVVEVSSDEGTNYHITLEDSKHWTIVKADNYGVITIDKKFRKG